MTNEHNEFYHSVNEPGRWAGKQSIKDIQLKGGYLLKEVIPSDIKDADETLAMVFHTAEGEINVDINSIPGLTVVRGDSSEHPHEVDGELLIEINYLKMDAMENKPRRIRPTGIKYGILGDTEKGSAEKGRHRAMGESADYYLEGYDTQYNPEKDFNAGLRYFPFWRLGIYGDQKEMAKEFLPEEQGEKE